jgi:hypothetical protein
MNPGPVEVTLKAGRLEMRWQGLASLSEVVPVCRLGDNNQHVGTSWQQHDDGLLQASCGPLEMQLRLNGDGRGLTASLTASANEACQVMEIGLRTKPSIGKSAPSWFLYSGYQSWDRAGLHRLDPLEGVRESWWTGGAAAESGTGIALAAQSCARHITRVEYRRGVLSVVQCAPPLGAVPQPMWAAEPNERWQGERVALDAGADVREVLRGLLPPPGKREPVRGWLSWYRYGPWVTSEDIVENASFLRQPDLNGLEYKVVQIDDGWQQAYGDWEANGRFTGLDALVGQLRDSGQVPGIWTAPFLVGVESRLAETAPDEWFVRTADGRRLTDPREGLPGEMQVLDCRNPDVLTHLRQVFSRLYDAGFRYFKIDYLYAGAHAGLEAFRRGVEVIREAIKDSYLLACGAPLMPVVGLVDGCRVGEDTARPIYNFETGAPQPTVFGDEVQWAARNLASRQALNGWFQLDADIALVGGNLPVAQARQLVTLAAISGGPFFASDDLPRLSPDRLALLTNPEVLALVGRGSAVPDWQPHPRDLPPAVWRLGDEAIAVFNWSSDERTFSVALDRHCQLRDLWERSDAGTSEGSLSIVLPPDGVRLLGLKSV